MTALLKCTDIVGGTLLLETDPPILTLHDVIFVPFHDLGSPAGVFDHERKMVLQSWYFRGQNPIASSIVVTTPYSLESVKEWAPDDLYIYGGWLHQHFGHFLLSSLSRFWSKLWERHRAAKIAVHTPIGLDAMFACPWFAALIQGMGLDRDRFVELKHTVKIRTLIVSAPAFQEESFVNRVYAEFCNNLGQAIASSLITTPNDRPVFLSKEKMLTGVQRIENEAAISATLQRAGVEIVYPETLAFEAQIALWYNRSCVASFANSALHTSIFAPGRTVFVLGYGDSLISNYPLVDKANRTDAHYFCPVPGSMILHGARNGFHTAHEARDPVGVAEDLLRAIDFHQRSASGRAGRPLAARAGSWRYVTTGPEHDDDRVLVNLALDKPAEQSSCHPYVPFVPINATSGILTGRFQFHTDYELNPWWEVDLQADARIVCVRLFNRVDNSQDRCDRFSISVRTDTGLFATVIYEERTLCRFGGLDGHAFEWILPYPVDARYVRVTLLGRDYLHLDQVEILGILLPEATVSDTAPRRSLLSRFLRRSKAI